MSTAPLLAIHGLHAAYGNIEALKGIDLNVQRGEIVALIGANGAGKSTLMMTVFGRPRARSGEILFDGEDITHTPTHQLARLRIAQSPEGRRIFARMSRPRLLMLDEPSLGLAPLITRQIFDAIRTLNQNDGLTVLIVEQNANHALKLAHRGYVMVNGLITMSGAGHELLERPEIRAAYLEGGRH